jgi:hypothetical protein
MCMLTGLVCNAALEFLLLHGHGVSTVIHFPWGKIHIIKIYFFFIAEHIQSEVNIKFVKSLKLIYLNM